MKQKIGGIALLSRTREFLTLSPKAHGKNVINPLLMSANNLLAGTFTNLVIGPKRVRIRVFSRPFFRSLKKPQK